MSWATLSNIFNVSVNSHTTGSAKRRTAIQKRGEVNECSDTTWRSVFQDIQSCAVRNRAEDEAAASSRRAPPPVPKLPLKRLEKPPEVVQEDEQEEADAIMPYDGSVLGPFSNSSLPSGVMEKLAGLMAKEDPYVKRDIGENAVGCPRFQFMKQCMAGRRDQCSHIWELLSDRERRDFYRACQLDSQTSNCFFLSIMEPDTDCGDSSVCDLDEWSLLSGSRPGSDYSLR
jgi:hypothetical protein